MSIQEEIVEACVKRIGVIPPAFLLIGQKGEPVDLDKKALKFSVTGGGIVATDVFLTPDADFFVDFTEDTTRILCVPMPKVPESDLENVRMVNQFREHEKFGELLEDLNRNRMFFDRAKDA